MIPSPFRSPFVRPCARASRCLVLGDIPLPDILYRWHLGPLKIPFARLKILSDSHNRMPMDSRFCFEQVWFGRYACQLKTYDQSRAALLDIREQLRLRQITKAECRQILNIFWYHDDPPPDSLVEEYTYLAKVLNLRFVVCGPEVDDESDEHYDTWYTPKCSMQERNKVEPMRRFILTCLTLGTFALGIPKAHAVSLVEEPKTVPIIIQYRDADSGAVKTERFGIPCVLMSNNSGQLPR